MFFLRRQAHTNPLFKDFNIFKCHDKIALENCIFIHKSFKQQLPQAFDNWFPQIFMPAKRGGQIWAVLMYLLTELNYIEEILFVLVQIFTWNYLQNFYRNILFHQLTTKCLKNLHFLIKYV